MAFEGCPLPISSEPVYDTGIPLSCLNCLRSALHSGGDEYIEGIEDVADMGEDAPRDIARSIARKDGTAERAGAEEYFIDPGDTGYPDSMIPTGARCVLFHCQNS
jgi:hypothetical protein